MIAEPRRALDLDRLATIHVGLREELHERHGSRLDRRTRRRCRLQEFPTPIPGVVLGHPQDGVVLDGLPTAVVQDLLQLHQRGCLFVRHGDVFRDPANGRNLPLPMVLERHQHIFTQSLLCRR